MSTDVTEQDTGYDRNYPVEFLPEVQEDEGFWAPPCMKVGGILTFSYVKDGYLHVSIHLDEAASELKYPDTDNVKVIVSMQVHGDIFHSDRDD